MNELSSWRIRRAVPAEDFQQQYGYTSQSADEVPLSHYWQILVKRRNIVIPIALIVFLAGAYFALSATTLYTASATIKIEPQNPQVTGLGELQPLELRGEYDYYQTQFALLQSRPLAARVVNELGLEANRSFREVEIISPNPVDHIKSWLFRLLGPVISYIAPLLQSPTKIEGLTDESGSGAAPGAAPRRVDLELMVSPRVIDQYLGLVTIEPVRRTRLVSVQFTTPSAQLSQRLANAHVESFMRMNLENRFSLSTEARDFLDQKKTELRAKLEKAETALNKFRRAHGVVSVEKGENIVVDRLVEVNRQLTGARAQRIEAESLYRTVESRNNQDLAQVMTQGLVQQLKGNLATLEAEKARLGTVFKADHPRMKELTQQIAAAHQALNTEVANVVRGIKSSYAAAFAKERSLETEAARQQEAALRLREVGVDYTLLQEEVNTNRSLYESVLKRLSETNVTGDLAVSNMQIAERASLPLQRSGPNSPLYVLASLISGLFLGVGAAFLREFFDSTVGTPEAVWRAVGLGTLGVVPHLKSLKSQRAFLGLQFGQASSPQKPSQSTHGGGPAKELIIAHGPVSIMSESYRTIRASLLLSQAEKPPQIVLVTSPSPGEGKTVTSLNLAIALAHDGYSVLLIDGDMRRGCCHSRLGLTNNRGLSNVLTGNLALEEGVQKTSVGGLSLLSRGVIPPNPSELLGSRKMRSLLEELRQSYNFILIDSPPVISISDATVLSAVSDGVLLVFDGQNTSTAYAQKAVERLDMVRARILGVILNGINLENPEYSYYRAYSYYTSESPDDEEPPDPRNGNGGGGGRDFAAATSHAASAEKANENPPNSGVPNFAKSVHGAQEGNPGERQSQPGGRNPWSSQSTFKFQPGAVSQQFLDRLIQALAESIGPVAPLVVREKIRTLGESQDAFPKSRIRELLQLLQEEIPSAELRSRFRQKELDKDFAV
jgi:polysaccharide biosynthesis transport protein